MFIKIILVAAIVSSFSSYALNRSESPLQIEPFACCTDKECKVSITISNVTSHKITFDTYSITENSIDERGLNIYDATKFPENYEYLNFKMHETKVRNAADFANSKNYNSLYHVELEPYQKISREINNIHGLHKLEPHGDYLLNYAFFIHKLYVDGNLVEDNMRLFMSGLTDIYGYRMLNQ